MKTSLDMILDVLEKFKPFSLIHCKENSTIDAIDFIHISQKAFEPNILYLGKTSDFFALSGINSPLNLLLVTDCLLKPEYINNGMLNLIILDNSYDLDVIHKEIFNYLDSQRDFGQKSLSLCECLISGGGLQILANKYMELVDNPILIFDVNFSILAYSYQEPIDEPLYSEIIEKGFYPYERIMEAKKFGYFEKVYKSEAPQIFHFPFIKKRFLSWRISISGEIMGFISVLESKPFQKSDIELLSLLCNLVSIELLKGRTKHKKSIIFEHFISDLLNGKLLHNDLLKERLKYLDLKSNKTFYTLVVKSPIYSAGSIPLSYVRDALQQIVSSSKCAIYEDKIIMLIAAKQIPFSEVELSNLNRFFDDNQLIGGVSRSFTDISILKNYYIQSCKAIELGIRLDISKNIYFYEDYFEFHIIDMAAKVGDIKNICDPLIPMLMEYDRVNNCELVKSLYFYLLSGSNLTRTAKEFGIHRNTMDYRINKVEEVLNINLDDPNVTFSLKLSMKIMQLIEGKDFFECRKNCNKAIS